MELELPKSNIGIKEKILERLLWTIEKLKNSLTKLVLNLKSNKIEYAGCTHFYKLIPMYPLLTEFELNLS